eukprot:1440349-Rhodomonas_salina.3
MRGWSSCCQGGSEGKLNLPLSMLWYQRPEGKSQYVHPTQILAVLRVSPPPSVPPTDSPSNPLPQG